MSVTTQSVRKRSLKSKGFSKFLVRDSTIIRLSNLMQKPLVRGIDNVLITLMDEIEQLRKEMKN